MLALLVRLCRIEPFLAKCFGCVEKLRYTDDLDVVGMISKEGEELGLCEQVDTGAHRGAVEKWLAQLERVARLSVKMVSRICACVFLSSLLCRPRTRPI